MLSPESLMRRPWRGPDSGQSGRGLVLSMAKAVVCVQLWGPGLGVESSGSGFRMSSSGFQIASTSYQHGTCFVITDVDATVMRIT